jgi:FkbM family methyltransferase
MTRRATCTADLVFDVGAHRGEDSEFYLKLGYRVIAVEANPELCRSLKERFAEHVRSGAFTLAPYAIDSKDGEIVFYINRQLSVWGTASPDWALRNKGMGADSEEIRVPAIRFAKLLNRYGCPYYLKVDIEGADMQCIRALREIPGRPKYLSVESSKTSWDDLLEEFRVLEELGYRQFQVVDQRCHSAKDGRFVGLAGRAFDYRFPVHSSGPFGEYLGGEWLSREEALRKYRKIFFWYHWFGDNTVGGRIARRIPVLRGIIRRRVRWYDTHARYG